MDILEVKVKLLEAEEETIIEFSDAVKVSRQGDTYKVEVTGFHPEGFPHWDGETLVASWEGPGVDVAAQRVVDALVGVPASNKERGKGKGVGGEPQGDEGASKCVCPNCGREFPHEKGTPCNEAKCPDCDVALVGKQYKPPPGWDDPWSWLNSKAADAADIRRRAWEGMGGTHHDCVARMGDTVDDPDRFCGALKAAVEGYGPRYGKEFSLMSYIEAEMQGWAAVEKVIVDEGNEVVLYSKDKSRVLGRYPYGKGKKYKDKDAAVKAAEAREREVQYFKHQESLDELLKEVGLVPFFESRLHLLSTMMADELYGAGEIDKETRLKLSHAIGQALDAYSKAMADDTVTITDESAEQLPPPMAAFWKKEKEPTARMFLAAAKAYLQRKESETVVWQEGDRRFYLGLISLPSIRDREKELVTMEGADFSIDLARRYKYRSGLYIKHVVPKSLVGRLISERRIGPFWVEFGEFKDTPLADWAFRILENDREGKWRFSIGFITPKKQALAGRYTRLLKFDSTITEVPAQPLTAMLALIKEDGGNIMDQSVQKLMTFLNPETDDERAQVTKMLGELFEIEEKELLAIVNKSEEVEKVKAAIGALEDDGLKSVLLAAIDKAGKKKKPTKAEDEEEEEDDEEEKAAAKELASSVKELTSLVKGLTIRVEAVEASAGQAAIQELREALLTRAKDYPKPSETAEDVADGAEILAKLEKMLNPGAGGKHQLSGFACGPGPAEGGAS